MANTITGTGILHYRLKLSPTIQRRNLEWRSSGAGLVVNRLAVPILTSRQSSRLAIRRQRPYVVYTYAEILASFGSMKKMPERMKAVSASFLERLL
jgi:hypothetical protein